LGFWGFGVIFLVGRKIQKQKQELEELNSFKSKILAIVSHDIKYPMQEVVGVIDLFNHELVSKGEIEELLPEIKQKTENLIELITNLLQWAEGQMDSFELKKEEFSLLKILKEIQSSVKNRLKDKGLKLSIPKEDITIVSNAAILKIVIRNLVTNAVKFSFKKSIIEVTCQSEKNCTIISVTDSGTGLDQKIASNLFKSKVESSLGTEGEIGSGVGLTICNDFIQRLGGEMSVESEKGKGSTFSIKIPNEKSSLTKSDK